LSGRLFICPKKAQNPEWHLNERWDAIHLLVPRRALGFFKLDKQPLLRPPPPQRTLDTIHPAEDELAEVLLVLNARGLVQDPEEARVVRRLRGVPPGPRKTAA